MNSSGQSENLGRAAKEEGATPPLTVRDKGAVVLLFAVVLAILSDALVAARGDGPVFSSSQDSAVGRAKQRAQIGKHRGQGSVVIQSPLIGVKMAQDLGLQGEVLEPTAGRSRGRPAVVAEPIQYPMFIRRAEENKVELGLEFQLRLFAPTQEAHETRARSGKVRRK